MDSLPTTISHYEIEALLGRGEIALVYRAINSLNGQEVALKVLRADSQVVNARHYFENESKVLAQLHHPNIPIFYEYIPGEPPCLVMSLIDGKDGESLVTELPEGMFLPIRSVIQWSIQIANALAYLHNRYPPIVFRDLKAAHVMVNRPEQAWLVDFNLAKLLPSHKLLTDADRIGTEGFAAPEQYRGVVSPLVDIYALGATMHYLLTRIDPRSERRFSYVPVRAINAAIPKSVAQIVSKALAYDVEDRYQDMEELREALKKVLTEM